MANRNKFEEMLERLVNEDREGAEELFHEIVVEKSRDIYETLLAEEAEEDDIDEATDEEVDESEDDLEESEDEDIDESEEDELDESDDDDLDESFFDEMGAEDPVDDMMGDIEMPDAGDDMGDMGGDDMGMGDEGGDIEDRVMDLEDELEALKAEFEAMMGDEAGDDDDMDGDDEMPMDMDSEEGDDDEGDDEGDDDDDGEDEMPFESKSATEQMREYVEKVAPAKMGDNGANAKSTVAGKHDMGGTTANLRGGESKSEGTQGGLAAPTPKDMNTKNVNVPGAKGATKMSNQPGHGAEKKGKPETADKGAGSPLNGAPKRAK